jgi:hypothetical protein
MREQEDNSNKTSRRQFTKTAMTAIIAVPALTSLAEAHEAIPVSVQKNKKMVAPVHGTEDARSEHNTPPPILIGDGSLIVERSGEYLVNDVVTQNSRNHHKMNADGGHTKLYPAHIKVIDGSGEVLYRNDTATECVVTMALIDPDNTSSTAIVNAGASPIVSNRRSFVIDTDGNKLLKKTNERPASTKRNVRYRHKDNGNKEFSIVDVKVTQGADVLFRVTLSTLPAGGEELKVLIWLEQM